MKKKILQLVAVFVAALTGQPALAQTEFTVGDFTYQVLEDDPTAVALKQAAATIEGAVVIPPAVENEEVTYTVKQILGYAFSSTGITSVTIPASVDSIGQRSFGGCASLASIRIEDGAETLILNNGYYGTFAYSDGEKTVYQGRNLKVSEVGTVYDSNVTSVEFGKQVTSFIDNYMYSNGDMTSVKAPWTEPFAVADGSFNDNTYTNATLWVPGGTKAAYQAADGWKKFGNMDFSSFVVSVTANNGGSLAVADISATDGETAETLIDRETDAVFTITAEEGYELTAMTVNEEAVTPTGNAYTVENLLADQAAVATFAPITYSIAYTLNGGATAAENPATYTIESEAITLVNPTKAGYDFAGWTGTDLTAATKTVTIAAGSMGERSYTATWTPVAYAISYDLAGGATATENPATYTIESEDFTLVNPTKDYYDFAGWTGTDLDAATKTVTIATGSMGARSYTATWEKKTYTVSITGGGVTADNYSPKYGDDVTITIEEDEDRNLTSLTVNGTDVTAAVSGNQYTITGVSANIAVVATFTSTKEFITMINPQATFSCKQDVNFTGIDAVKAYIATGYSKSTGKVLLTRVYDVPAGTGLILFGTEGETTKVPYSEGASYYTNLLKAVTTAKTVPTTEGEYTNFLLGEKSGVVGFYISSGEGEVPAGKSYLQLPTSFIGSGAKYGVVEWMFEDEVTAIDDIIWFSGKAKNGNIYDINGRKMNGTPKQGAYIIDGVKVAK